MRRRTSTVLRPCRHWWIALCSLSTGSTVDAAAAGSVHHQRARHDQDFLVGQRDPSCPPRSPRAPPRGRPCRTTRRARCRRRGAWPRRSGRRRRIRPAPAGPPRAAPAAPARRRAPGRSPSRSSPARARRPARRSGRRSRRPRAPTTRSASGCAATTASALWPIEPVEPRIAMRSHHELQVADEDVVHGRGEQQLSMRSSTPPCPGNQRAGGPSRRRCASAATRTGRRRCPAPRCRR